MLLRKKGIINQYLAQVHLQIVDNKVKTQIQGSSDLVRHTMINQFAKNH